MRLWVVLVLVAAVAVAEIPAVEYLEDARVQNCDGKPTWPLPPPPLRFGVKELIDELSVEHFKEELTRAFPIIQYMREVIPCLMMAPVFFDDPNNQTLLNAQFDMMDLAKCRI